MRHALQSQVCATWQPSLPPYNKALENPLKDAGSANRAISFPQRFSVLRQIGAGGMGLVFEARDLERDIRVALKTLSRVSANTLYLFKQEFRALSGLAHPNLAALYELCEENGQYFLSMEYIEGVDFLKYLHTVDADAEGASRGEILEPTRTVTMTMIDMDAEVVRARRRPAPFDESRLRATFRQVAEGLNALHSSGRLHRDIKPTNVMVEENGRAVLLDFGLVVELDEPRFGQETSASMAGTLPYMPPEQFRMGTLTPAADWYAAGAMLFEALTGTLPYRGSAGELLAAKNSRVAPRASTLNPAAPPDLDELCARLLERDPARRPSGNEVMEALGASGSRFFFRSRTGIDRVFVGREAELARLREAADTALKEPVFASVSGVSGAGKSALIEHFLETYSRDPAVLVFHGRCYEQEAVPYKAVDSLIDRVSRYLAQLPDHAARALLPAHAGALATVFPVLGRTAAFASAVARASVVQDGVELRRQAFGAFRELLRNLARGRKLALYIDDLQWSDLDSAALLAEVLHPGDAPRLLLLCSYRSEYAGSAGWRALVDKLEGNPMPRCEIALAALSADESADLARRLLGSEGSLDRVQTLVHDSGGLPYFIRELAQAAEGAGTAMTLDQLIWARVEALPPEPRTLLEVVAVAGWPIPQTDAFRAAGLSGRSPRTLNMLRSGGLVRSSGPRELDKVEPLHDRIRETVVAHLSNQGKFLRHEQLADTLEATQHAEPEVLALHLEACGRMARAGMYFGAAADHAAAAVAFDRAVDLYERALRLAELSKEERSATEVKLAQAHSNAGRSAAAGRTYLEAAGHASGRQRLLLEGRAASYLCIAGRYDEGLDLMRAVARRLDVKLPRGNVGLLFSILVRDMQFRRKRHRLRTRAPGEMDADQLALIDFLWDVTRAIGYSGMFAAVEVLLRTLSLSADAGEPYRLGRAALFYYAGKMTAGASEWPEFTEGLETVRKLFREAGDPAASGVLLSVAQSQATFLSGRYADALEHARQASSAIRDGVHGMNWERSTVRLTTLWSLYMLGRYEDLRSESDVLAEDARLHGDLFTETGVGVASMPLILLAEDKPAAARQCNEEHIARWPYQGFTLQHTMALESSMMILLYEGRQEEALELLERSRASLRRLMLLRHAVVTEFFLTLEARCHLGLAAAGRDRGRHLGAAAKLGQRIGRISTAHAEAAACGILGAVAHFRGQDEDSARLVHRSIDGFAALGMEMHANTARLRLAEWMGSAGSSLKAEAEEYMTRQHIAAPNAIARVWMM